MNPTRQRRERRQRQRAVRRRVQTRRPTNAPAGPVAALEPLEQRTLMSTVPFGADYRDTSEFLLGDVFVTVVLLESDGSIDANQEDWTSSEINTVKSEVAEGAQWWTDTLAAQFPDSPHTLSFQFDFTYTDAPLEIGYEPITRDTDDENLWVDAFLDEVGYNTGASMFTDMDRWNHDQRVANGSDWAVTVFIADSTVDSDGRFADGWGSYAYFGGPFMMLTTDNQGWGLDRMGHIFAHELGHNFYALDEYPGADDYTDFSGYYNTQNVNARDGHPDPSSRVDSIMAEGSKLSAAWTAHTSSPSSLEMVGWKDSDGDGIFDVLDVDLTLTGSGSYDGDALTYSFSGNSNVNTLPNQNPYGYGHDITINTVDTLQYRIDGGTWIDAASYGEHSTAVGATADLSALAGGDHTIAWRTIDADTCVMSNVISDTFTSQGPEASDDSYATNEDTVLTVNAGNGVLANDSGNNLSATLLSGPTHGSLSFNADGSFTYTPDANYHGSDSFTYQVGVGDGGIGTVTVTTNSVNDNPAATDDSYSASDGATLTVNAANGVLDNDSDADGDAFTAALETGPAHGSLSLNADGSFTYTPDDGFIGVDTFTYRANDGSANSNAATVSIQVTSDLLGHWTFDNTAADASGNGNDGAVQGATYAAGFDGNALSFDGSNDYVDLGALDVQGDVLTITAWFNADSFLETHQDNRLVSKATGTSEGDHYWMLSTISSGGETRLRFRLKTGGTTTTLIADAGAISTGQWHHAAAVYDGSTMKLYLDGVEVGSVAKTGNVDVNAAVSAWIGANPPSATSNPFDGLIDDVRLYERGLDANEIQALATVSNDAPTASNDSYSINEDQTLTVNLAAGLLNNDSDPDGDSLTASLVNGPASGTLSLNGNGSFSYTPNANFNGSDGFTYQISDGRGGTDQATVTITVNAANDAPTASQDSYAVDEDQSLVINAAGGVLANDSDADGDGLTASLVAGPANGDLTFNADGSFTYTPDANYAGLDSFTYQVSDGEGGTATATAVIVVNPTNDAPTATDDNYAASEDQSLTVNAANGVLVNDTDADGDNLSASVVSGPSNGSLSLNANGSFTYTPDADFSGMDSFTYRISDGNGGTDEATAIITVSAVNDAPVAGDDSYQVDEDATLTVDAAGGVLNNDSDEEGDSLSATIVSSPSDGSLTLNADGSFTYTPDANFHGVDSFTYQVSDGQGGAAQATVLVTVDPTNDAPVASDDNYATNEDQALTVNAANGVLDNDGDIDGDNLSASVVSGPSNGSLSLNANGSFTYTPDADFSGMDSFTYQISDGNGGADQATVVIAVNDQNDVPTAGDDSYTTDEDQTLTVNAANGVSDNDSDNDGDSLSATIVNDPSDGSLTLNADGSFTYTPDANFHGVDSFTYQVSDGQGGAAQATVLVTVDPVNDDPTTANDSYSTDEDQTLTLTAGNGVLANDSDVDGDNLSASVVSGPANGSLSLNANGSFTYTPDADFSGVDSFTYQVSDGHGGSETATVVIAVEHNDDPVATDDSYTTNEDQSLTVNAAAGVLANDGDSDGDAISASIVNGPSDGTLTLNANGSFTYTPDAGFHGVDSFTYAVSDGRGGTDQATVIVAVHANLTAPNQTGPSGTTNDTTPTFTWSAVEGATGYIIALNNQTTGQTVESNTSVAGTSFTSSTTLTDGHTYRWWVQAVGAGGNGPWSAGANLTIDAAPTLTAPSLIGPSGTTDDTTPTFSWSSVNGATGYEFYLRDQTTGQVIHNNTAVAGTSFTANTLTDGHDYRWWVQAIGAGGEEGPWSSGMDVTVEAQTLAAPNLIGPSGTTDDTTPTFTWSSVNGATGYEISIKDETTGQTLHSNVSVAGTSFTANTLTAGHDYRWWVQAIGAGGEEGPWSSGMNFAVEAETLAAPNLVGPSGTTSDTTPTFTWSSVSGATGYEISVVDQTSGQTVHNNTAVAGTSFTANALTNGHNYRWWVQAVGAGGVEGAWSSGMNFAVEAATLAAPTLVGPSGTTSDTTPTFTWSSVNGATGYQISITDKTSGQVVYNNMDVAGTSFTASLTAGHDYRWWVQAIGAGNVQGPWSGGMNVTVESLAAPNQISPSGSTSDTTPTFNWAAVSGAVAYELALKNMTTGVVVEANTVVNGTSFTASPLTSGHDYRWWVRGVDDEGNKGEWSSGLNLNIV